MFNEEFTAASKGAAAKSALLKKNPVGYFLLSMLAGAYIGFGILLVFTLSGALAGAPYTCAESCGDSGGRIIYRK